MRLSRCDFFGRAGAVHLSVVAVVAIGSTSQIAAAAEFTLMPSPQTVHIGHFAASVKPVLSIESGDIVTIETSALLPPEVVDQSGVVPPSAVPQYQRDIFREVKDRGTFTYLDHTMATPEWNKFMTG